MFRFVTFTTLFVTVFASHYGNLYGGGHSYGGSYGGSYAIPAAIHSSRSIQYIDTPSYNSPALPVNIVVPAARTSPINMLFRSRSSDINVASHHIGSRGSYRATSSVDEPHRLLHTVTRPIIQEVREIVTPYRNVQQEIRPVQEQVQTLVARGLTGGYGGNNNYGNYGNRY